MQVGKFEYASKNAALTDFRRIANSEYLTFEDMNKVVSLAQIRQDLRDRIKTGIKDIISEDGLLYLVMPSDNCVHIPYTSLLDKIYGDFVATSAYQREKGLREFVSACRRASKKVKLDTVLDFIEFKNLRPREICYVKRMNGELYLKDEVAQSFRAFVKIINSHSHHDFYQACRQAINGKVPSARGKQAHHANEGGFAQIVKDFIEENNIKLNEVYFLPNGTQGARFADYELKRQFVEYHNSRAEYEMLTESEHKERHKAQSI